MHTNGIKPELYEAVVRVLNEDKPQRIISLSNHPDKIKKALHGADLHGDVHRIESNVEGEHHWLVHHHPTKRGKYLENMSAETHAKRAGKVRGKDMDIDATDVTGSDHSKGQVRGTRTTLVKTYDTLDGKRPTPKPTSPVTPGVSTNTSQDTKQPPSNVTSGSDPDGIKT